MIFTLFLPFRTSKEHQRVHSDPLQSSSNTLQTAPVGRNKNSSEPNCIFEKGHRTFYKRTRPKRKKEGLENLSD